MSILGLVMVCGSVLLLLGYILEMAREGHDDA